MYKLIKKLIPATKYSLKSPYTMTPTRIVIHNTANDASARNEISYMTTNSNAISFHYAIDNLEVVQGLPENRNGWHAGDGPNGTGNRKGIGIEICYSKSGGTRFTQAEKNASIFVATLLKKYGWTISKVTKHQDYSSYGKYCPHRTLDLGWQRFLNMVAAELKKLTPPPPPVAKITYEPIKKQVILIRDANLWNFDFTNWSDAKAVASYPKGDLVEVVAKATNVLKAQYYMTAYSYNGGKIRATNGFNITDCKDYTPPPVVVEPPEPVPEPIPEPIPEPTPDPIEPPTEPVDPSEGWLVKFLKWLIKVLTYRRENNG